MKGVMLASAANASQQLSSSCVSCTAIMSKLDWRGGLINAPGFSSQRLYSSRV